MLKNNPKQLSLYSVLYNRIPENHILKKINSAIDFSFVNKLLEGSYCKYYGRSAKEPEMMLKFLFLERLYDLSDERVISETSVNLAYMWFVGLNPDDELPDPSLLSKFRTQRLKDFTLDDIIKEIVRQSVKRGVINGSAISVDATHVVANTKKKVPERIIKHLAKKIFKSLEKEMGQVSEGINTNIPNYKEIEDHKEAKQIMKDYLKEVIQEVQNEVKSENIPQTMEVINKAQDILDSKNFIEQKGIRSLVDEDARVGYKSKTESFFGYKVEFAMTSDERIITAVHVADGAYVDGTRFEDLYNNTKECGIEIKETSGDKAYFRKHILDILKNDEVEAIIPVSESVYRIDESKFSYNKDSDQWFCECGNYTVKKKLCKDKHGYQSLRYTFEKETCRNCPKRQECITEKSTSKILKIGVNAPEFYEYSQKAKTPEFIERYKKRAGHEWKNGEMKRFHGLNRAKGYGIRSMTIQAKLTAIAVNLKRIAALVSSLNEHFCNIFDFLLIILATGNRNLKLAV